MVLSETLTILPSPSAVVEQYHPLTIYCTYSGNQSVVIVTWSSNGVEVAALLPGPNETCIFFAGLVDNYSYQYSCGTQFNITIKNVTKERHAEEWNCNVNTGIQTLRSTSTTVFVQGKTNCGCGKYKNLYKTVNNNVYAEKLSDVFFLLFSRV